MKHFYFLYPGWTRGAITFSYDDGRVFDRQLVELLNRHHLKGTFNLCPGTLDATGRRVVSPQELATTYAGHEIASHGFRHARLTELNGAALRREIADGKHMLEDILGRPVRGFASPYGHHGRDVQEAMQEAGIVYGRSTVSSLCTLGRPGNWLAWNPSEKHDNHGSASAELLRNSYWGGTLHTLYVWGHSYEFDQNKPSWEDFEKYIAPYGEMVEAGKIWAATNIDIYDYWQARELVRTSADGQIIENLSNLDIYGSFGVNHADGEDAQRVLIPAGSFLDLRTAKPDADGVLRGGAHPAINPVVRLLDREETLPEVAEADTVLSTPNRVPFRWVWPGFREKSLTWSWDDGMRNDRYVVATLDMHGMRGSFNLNPAGLTSAAPERGKEEEKWNISRPELPTLFAEQEVTVHGNEHGTWDSQPVDEVVNDVRICRNELEALVGYPVTGMAYPCGEYSWTDELLTVLRACGLTYGRAVRNNDYFSLPDDFLFWAPTLHWNDKRLLEVGKSFLDSLPNGCYEPQLCYIWGHSFEFTKPEDKEFFESFCELFDGRDDVWHATNLEIEVYTRAARSLVWAHNGASVYNPSDITICAYRGNKPMLINPGLNVL